MTGSSFFACLLFPGHVASAEMRTRPFLALGLALSCAPSPRGDPVRDLAIRLNCAAEEGFHQAELRRALDAEVARARRRTRGLKREKLARELGRVLFEETGFSYRAESFTSDTALSAALIRRRGNCLACSLLYFLVARELGMPVALVQRPGHVHVRWVGPRPFEIEAVSGGKVFPLGHFEKREPVRPADARDFGYGRPLSDQETAGFLWAHFAHVHFLRGRIDETLDALDEALALWPGYVDMIIDRLIALECAPGRRGEARRGYERLRREHPGGETETAALVGLARMLQVEGMHEEALALLGKARKLAPRYYSCAVTAPLGWSLMATGRRAEAFELFESEGGSCLADAALACGEATRALELAERAKGWRGELSRARALAASGRREEALALIGRLEPVEEDADEHALRLAAALSACGETDEAEEALGRALRISPGGRVLRFADGFTWPEEMGRLIDAARDSLCP